MPQRPTFGDNVRGGHFQQQDGMFVPLGWRAVAKALEITHAAMFDGLPGVCGIAYNNMTVSGTHITQRHCERGIFNRFEITDLVLLVDKSAALVLADQVFTLRVRREAEPSAEVIEGQDEQEMMINFRAVQQLREDLRNAMPWLLSYDFMTAYAQMAFWDRYTNVTRWARNDRGDITVRRWMVTTDPSRASRRWVFSTKPQWDPIRRRNNPRGWEIDPRGFINTFGVDIFIERAEDVRCDTIDKRRLYPGQTRFLIHNNLADGEYQQTLDGRLSLTNNAMNRGLYKAPYNTDPNTTAVHRDLKRGMFQRRHVGVDRPNVVLNWNTQDYALRNPPQGLYDSDQSSFYIVYAETGMAGRFGVVHYPTHNAGQAIIDMLNRSDEQALAQYRQAAGTYMSPFFNRQHPDAYSWFLGHAEYANGFKHVNNYRNVLRVFWEGGRLQARNRTHRFSLHRDPFPGVVTDEEFTVMHAMTYARGSFAVTVIRRPMNDDIHGGARDTEYRLVQCGYDNQILMLRGDWMPSNDRRMSCDASLNCTRKQAMRVEEDLCVMILCPPGGFPYMPSMGMYCTVPGDETLLGYGGGEATWNAMVHPYPRYFTPSLRQYLASFSEFEIDLMALRFKFREQRAAAKPYQEVILADVNATTPRWQVLTVWPVRKCFQLSQVVEQLGALVGYNRVLRWRYWCPNIPVHTIPNPGGETIVVTTIEDGELVRDEIYSFSARILHHVQTLCEELRDMCLRIPRSELEDNDFYRNHEGAAGSPKTVHDKWLSLARQHGAHARDSHVVHCEYCDRQIFCIWKYDGRSRMNWGGGVRCACLTGVFCDRECYQRGFHEHQRKDGHERYELLSTRTGSKYLAKKILHYLRVLHGFEYGKMAMKWTY